MLDFRVRRVELPFITGQEQFMDDVFDFDRPVRVAEVVLNGFDISFDNGDHHFKRLAIDCNLNSIMTNLVNFQVHTLLRDDSGNIDDPYGGWVEVMVIADLV